MSTALALAAGQNEAWLARNATNTGAPSEAPASAAGLSVTLQGLGKRFGDKSVLKGLDLHIPAGQFVAVVERAAAEKARCCASSSGSMRRRRASSGSERDPAHALKKTRCA